MFIIRCLSRCRIKKHCCLSLGTNESVTTRQRQGQINNNTQHVHSAARILTLAAQRRTMSSGHPSTICLADYDAYGFDLDHTLAKYKLVEVFNLTYSCITDFLVDKKGYDASIKSDLFKYKEFICKGLFLDMEKGHILKIADDGKILRATHGTRALETAEVQAAYGEDQIWKHAETVKKTVKNSNTTFRFFENYFDTPGLVAMARIIDIEEKKIKDSKSTKRIDYTLIWGDVLDSLVHIYTYHNFALETGGFFPTLKKNPNKYVEKCSDDIKKWLRSLKQDGRCVFLLTSSFSDFGSCLLETILGDDWESYFDINIFYARKPSFFTDGHAFQRIEKHSVKEPTKNLVKGGFYYRGNERELTKFIATLTGKENPKIVYFGDNICADCFPSKMYADWDTVLLLEEMDAEGYACDDGTVQQEDEPSQKKRRRGIEHSSLVTHEEMEYLISDVWGPFLYHGPEGASDKVMNTLWGSVISQYSDITVPSLEYLAGVPLDHKFESFGAKSDATGGFHPGKPASLL
ncbi:5'-nucleotidase domain-containing protein 1-like [Haliotis rufescens]|uniref:5'-nucleotidase domain-containing protein 1-like n=1 Tax=Haliotis rufescens TaxID=6454 RepID=UPI001EAFEBE3|nr:5'-nucleotidase domain-containing protein 1-like [Haliotis rufescens]